MANDGRAKEVFTSAQIEFFKEFRAWDLLPEPIKENKYADFIKECGAGIACQALHEYERWKRQNPLPPPLPHQPQKSI